MRTKQTEAHDGRPMYIRGKALRGLMAAKHDSVLTVVRRALAGGRGIAAACELLDVGRETLRRCSLDWPELAKVLADGAMAPEVAGALGPLGWSGKRKRAKHG